MGWLYRSATNKPIIYHTAAISFSKRACVAALHDSGYMFMCWCMNIPQLYTSSAHSNRNSLCLAVLIWILNFYIVSGSAYWRATIAHTLLSKRQKRKEKTRRNNNKKKQPNPIQLYAYIQYSYSSSNKCFSYVCSCCEWMNWISSFALIFLQFFVNIQRTNIHGVQIKPIIRVSRAACVFTWLFSFCKFNIEYWILRGVGKAHMVWGTDHICVYLYYIGNAIMYLVLCFAPVLPLRFFVHIYT